MRKLAYLLALCAAAAFLGCDGDDGGSGPGPEEGPIPGGTGVWIVDRADHQLYKFSLEGELLGHQEYMDLDTPEEISVYQADGSVWVSEISYGSVAKFTDTGELVKTLTNVGAVAVSVNQNDGSCWVCDQVGDRVLRLDAAGDVKATATGFLFPSDVACYSTDGSCWVADTSKQRLVKLSPAGGQLKVVHLLGDPGLVAVDPNNGNCWASDGGDLIKVSPSGTILKRIVEPCGNHGFGTLAVSPVDGAAYIFGGNDKLMRFNAGGTKAWEKAGLNTVRYVVVNKNDNTVWVSGNEPGKVYKMSSSGGIIKEVTSSFETPWGCDIHY